MVVEAVLPVSIRDSLLLNVVTLIHPVDWIATWQLGTLSAPR